MKNKKNIFENVLNPFANVRSTLLPYLSKDEVVKLLKITPEALEAFESAYKKEILDNSDENKLFGISLKQAKDKKEDIESIDDPVLKDKIVKELLAQTSVWEYIRSNKDMFTVQTDISYDVNTPVTINDLNSIEKDKRPQLAGNVVLKTCKDEAPAGQQLLFWYSQMVDEKRSEKDRKMAYSMFRKGLDILDLDEISYRIIGKNQTSMGYWLPKIAPLIDCEGFFKIPNTKIMKVPLPVLQLTFAEYTDLNRTTLDIVDQFCMEAFRLNLDSDYFIKTGVFSSKFDFRNARVCDPKEIREMGEYFLFIHNMSRTIGFMSYGAATTNEWVVREFISDCEDNLTIYHGLPLHTEYRVFVDFDAKEVLGIHPYWDPDVMKKHFDDASNDDPDAYHDYCTYSVNEDKLMKRYEKNKDLVNQHVQKLLELGVNMEGQWSLDIMQNGSDFWFIDMAQADVSAFRECIPAGKLKPSKQNWLPDISERGVE